MNAMNTKMVDASVHEEHIYPTECSFEQEGNVASILFRTWDHRFLKANPKKLFISCWCFVRNIPV